VGSMYALTDMPVNGIVAVALCYRRFQRDSSDFYNFQLRTTPKLGTVNFRFYLSEKVPY
jgi:hypothetical protein